MDLGEYPSPQELEQQSSAAQSNLDLLINAISSDPVASEQQILQQHLQQSSPDAGGGGGESTGYSLQEVLEGLVEGRRLEEESDRLSQKRKAPERSSSVLDSLSHLITSDSITETIGQSLVPGNSLLTTIKAYHVSTAQKSYGDEKRLFPSAPLLTISPRPPYPISLSLSTLFDTGTTSSRQTVDIVPSDDANGDVAVVRFKDLRAGQGKGGKAKKFVLKLEISPIHSTEGVTEQEDSGEGGSSTGLVHAEDCLLDGENGPSNDASTSSLTLSTHHPNSLVSTFTSSPFLTYHSNPIQLLSKPTKTALKVKPTSTPSISSSASSSSSSSSPHAVLSNSLISIFCRINSQAVRTRHLTLDDRQRLSVLTLERSTPFRIVASSDSASPSHALHYGETVRLVDVATGLQTEELRICRFEPGKGKAAAKGKGKAKEGSAGPGGGAGGKLYWNEVDGGEVRQLQKVGFLRVRDGGARWWLSSAGDGNQGGTPSTVAETDEVDVREKRGERKRVRVRYEGSEEEGKLVGYSKGVDVDIGKEVRHGEVEGKEGEEGWEGKETAEGKDIENETQDEVDVGDDFVGWNFVGISDFTISYFPLHFSLSSFPPPTPISSFPILLSARSYRPSQSTIELLVADFLPPSSDSATSPPDIYLGSFGPLPYQIIRSHQSTSTEHGLIFNEGEKRSHSLLEVTLPKLDDPPPPPLPQSSKTAFEEHHQQWDPSSSSEHVDGGFGGVGDWSAAVAGEEGGGDVLASHDATNSAGEPIPSMVPRPLSEDEMSMNRRGLPLLFVLRDRGFGVLSGKSIAIETVVSDAGETTIARVI